MTVIEELFKACEDGNLYKLKRLIVKGVDVHSKDEMLETALMKGCRQGHLEIVRELLRNGSNVNEKSMSGMSPLFLACMEGYLEIVKELIKYGANVNEKDIAGVTPLMRANSLEIVRELIKNCTNLDEKDVLGRTALVYAYEDKNIDKMAELISSGIDISVVPDEELQRLSKDNNILGISIAIRKGDYEGLSECLGKYYEDLNKTDSDRNLKGSEPDDTKHTRLVKLIRVVKTAKVKIFHKSKKGIGKLFKRVAKKKKHIKKEMVKPLEETENYLNNAGDALEKIDQAKKYIANIKRSKYMMDQRKIKQELEKDIKAIGDCSDECKLEKTVREIALKRNIKCISSKDLIAKLEERLHPINKVQQQIKNFETRIDLDYKHIVFEGINLSKKNTNKGREIF